MQASMQPPTDTLGKATSSESARSRFLPSQSASTTARQARKLTQKRAFLSAGLATVVVPSLRSNLLADTSWTGHVRGLSGAIVIKNSEVASKLRELSDGYEARKDKDHPENGHASDSQEVVHTTAAMTDLKSTIDIVEKELKSLLSGNKESAIESTTGQQRDNLDDDDAENGRAQLLRRLQIYRYKRRISPPTLPLLPLDQIFDEIEVPAAAERQNDKIERNLRTSRLGFHRTRHSRAKLFNQRNTSRSKLAEEHRRKTSKMMQEKALQKVSDYEARVRPVVEQVPKRGMLSTKRSVTQPVMNLQSTLQSTSHSIGAASS